MELLAFFLGDPTSVQLATAPLSDAAIIIALTGRGPFVSYLKRFRTSDSLMLPMQQRHFTNRSAFSFYRLFRREADPTVGDDSRTMPPADFQARFNSICEALARVLPWRSRPLLDRPSSLSSILTFKFQHCNSITIAWNAPFHTSILHDTVTNTFIFDTSPCLLFWVFLTVGVEARHYLGVTIAPIRPWRFPQFLSSKQGETGWQIFLFGASISLGTLSQSVFQMMKESIQ